MKTPTAPPSTRRTRPRIVMISPVLPYALIPHAGGGYVWRLCHVLQELGDLTVLAADFPSNRHAESDETAFTPNIVLRPSTPLKDGFARLARRLQDVLHRIDPGAPDLVFSSLLFLDRGSRRLIRDADVIDLQWSPYSRLWPVLRLMNRRARLIGTFHDVDSQRLRRTAQDKPDLLRRARWLIGARIAEFFEGWASRHLDRVIVFSHKDRELIGRAAGRRSIERVTVVDPPLGSPDVPDRSPSSTPTVLMVAFFGRQENLEAADWLLSAVWPAITAAVPEAELRLVGADPSGSLAAQMARAHNVTLTGFVNDLWAEYAQATVAVVPLLSGAGVKFKTIEALLAGAPVVSTSVGAEGIAGDEVLTAVIDDPAAFASAVIDVLRKPEAAEIKASRARPWAEGAYGVGKFRQVVKQIYTDGLQ